MQFACNQDQTMLANSVRGQLARGASSRQTAEGVWHDLAALGALGATLPEEAGGFGGAGREMCLIAAELGRARRSTPYVPTVAMFAMLVAAGSSGAQRSELLGRVAAGELLGTLAWQERHSRYSLDDVETLAERSAGGWRISGRKAQVLYGEQSDMMVVTARTDEGIALFLVPAAVPGLTRDPLVLADGTPAADVVLDGVEVGNTARLSGGGDLLALGLDWGAVALAADTLACMDLLLERTIDYLKIRVQFGKPIGRNQALQHRASEMLMQIEKSRGMLVLAAESLTGSTVRERRRAVAQASYVIQQAARFVSEQAIQLHGGIGMTDDLDISHLFKRVFCNEMILGDGAHHLDVLQALNLKTTEAAA